MTSRKRSSIHTSKGNGRIKWNYDLKLALRILVEEDPRWNNVEKTFNSYLAECGLTQGAPKRVLQVQYAERKKKPEWLKICSPPETVQEEERRASLRAQLRNISTSSNLRTALDTSEAVEISYSTRSRTIAPKTVPIQPETSSFFNQNTTRKSATNGTLQQQCGFSTVAEKSQTIREDDSLTRRTKRTRFNSAVAPPIRPVRPITYYAGLQKVHKTAAKQKRSPCQSRSPQNLVDLHRCYGGTIRVSKAFLENSKQPLKSVAPNKAHPPLPGLLFRLWEQTSTSNHDSIDGFWARKYVNANIRPETPPAMLDSTDVWNHLNRNEEPSPFISTSNRLVWIVRGALSLLKRGETNHFLSVIDTTALDPRAVFWARAYKDSMHHKGAFTKGAGRYRGTYEFLVWKCIPKEAIIHTFAIRTLLELQQNSTLGQALRFEILSSNHSLVNKTGMLRAQSISLTPEIAAAIADFATFLSLGPHSPIEQLSHVVADLIEGWGFQIGYTGPESWNLLSQAFAFRLCSSARQPSDGGIKGMLKSQMAFLDGVRWGLGSPNARHSPDAIQKMLKKAKRVGLENPAALVTNGIDTAKMAVMMFDRSQQRLLNGTATHWSQQTQNRPSNGHPWLSQRFDDENDDDQADDNEEDGDEDDDDNDEYAVLSCAPPRCPASEEEIVFEDPDEVEEW